jgi:hypothetical protein
MYGGGYGYGMNPMGNMGYNPGFQMGANMSAQGSMEMGMGNMNYQSGQM